MLWSHNVVKRFEKLLCDALMKRGLKFVSMECSFCPARFYGAAVFFVETNTSSV
jgi:hypothetical protein